MPRVESEMGAIGGESLRAVGKRSRRIGSEIDKPCAQSSRHDQQQDDQDEWSFLHKELLVVCFLAGSACYHTDCFTLSAPPVRRTRTVADQGVAAAFHASSLRKHEPVTLERAR